MNCDRVQAALSERMDGERLSPRIETAVEEHVAGCSLCAAFEAGARRLRDAARFQVAAAVPDLVEPIMAAVAEERARRPAPLRPIRLRPRPARLRPRPPAWPRLARQLAPAVAALVVGAVTGSLSVGGPWQRPESGTVAAASVVRGVAAAASRLDAYHARFAITESHLAPEVPVRELGLNVWFRAPQRFRMDVADHTQYPTSAWTPTDLSLVVNASSWYSAGPSPCPSSPPSCPPRRSIVRRRVAFSASAPAPTDVVLPIATLADASGLEVIGRTEVMGRDAIEVALPFERATPLFPFLRLGGSWRPFFPEDRVLLWLDAESWFPLRYRVYPARDPDRRDWELRFGLPVEPPRQEVFEVTALSIDERAPSPDIFAIPEGGRSNADVALSLPSLAEASEATGFEPVTPARVAGLDLTRVVLPPPDTGPADETLITYSQGLSWLTLGETRGWTAPALYGGVGPDAERISLANGGVAYYEPATDERGRRLSIHANGTDLYIETNLTRRELVDVAGSLPVVGEPIPEDWRVRRSVDGVTERVSLDEGLAALGLAAEVPPEGGLPPGYAFASAELIRIESTTSLNLYYQQLQADLGDGPIRLHLEAGAELPPASSAVQAAVEVRGRQGRWTPDRHQLEWVEDGVYYSLDAPGLELVDLLAVAESMAPEATST